MTELYRTRESLKTCRDTRRRDAEICTTVLCIQKASTAVVRGLTFNFGDLGWLRDTSWTVWNGGPGSVVMPPANSTVVQVMIRDVLGPFSHTMGCVFNQRMWTNSGRNPTPVKPHRF